MLRQKHHFYCRNKFIIMRILNECTKDNNIPDKEKIKIFELIIVKTFLSYVDNPTEYIKAIEETIDEKTIKWCIDEKIQLYNVLKNPDWSLSQMKTKKSLKKSLKKSHSMLTSYLYLPFL